MHKHTIEAAKQLCRELRKLQTPAERALWDALRNRRFYKKKFLRQLPLFFLTHSDKESFYIADFYCHEHKLVIELDGRNHYFHKEFDSTRTDILNGRGLRVLRFRNEEVTIDLNGVLERIASFVSR